MSHARSSVVAVRQILGRIAYVTQASLLAWEEGIIVDETALPNGQVLMDLAFRRGVLGARTPNPRDAGKAVGRAGRRQGWGIQEAHLRRLIIMTRH